MLHFTERNFVVAGNLPTGANLVTQGQAGSGRSLPCSKALISSARNAPRILVRAKLKAKAGLRPIAGWKRRHNEQINPHQNRCTSDQSGVSARRFCCAGCEAKGREKSSKNVHTEKTITSRTVGWIAAGAFHRLVEKGKGVRPRKAINSYRPVSPEST
jgi:hypothetical protein